MASKPQTSQKPQRKRRPQTGPLATQPNTPFNATGAGTDNGSLTGGVLGVGAGEIQVTGYSSISDVIPSINSITVVADSGPTYTTTIKVVGACPSGSYDNLLEFTDQSGDTYTLRIYSDTVKTHTVSYNSSEPNVTGITWDI